jgi:enediyne biosynthesis protein E8
VTDTVDTERADADTLTLEAFADTIVPGERRFPGDVAVAGACAGPGAVAAGALALLHTEATGVTAGLPYLAQALDGHAAAHAAAQGRELAPDLPAFVALPFADRTAVVAALTAPGHPERDGWVALALFCNMAFDSAAHLPTAQALRDGHPGLRAMGFTDPDADGLWRFPGFSYGRPLADLHPATSIDGSPA